MDELGFKIMSIKGIEGDSPTPETTPRTPTRTKTNGK
jgi:hypothetical protein